MMYDLGTGNLSLMEYSRTANRSERQSTVCHEISRYNQGRTYLTLRGLILLGVLYPLYMMSCGSFPIKYDSHRGL